MKVNTWGTYCGLYLEVIKDEARVFCVEGERGVYFFKMLSRVFCILVGQDSDGVVTEFKSKTIGFANGCYVTIYFKMEGVIGVVFLYRDREKLIELLEKWSLVSSKGKILNLDRRVHECTQ